MGKALQLHYRSAIEGRPPIAPMEDEQLNLDNVKTKGSLYKRAKRKVKKVAGGGKSEPRLQRRPSTNPVSLAASEAYHATKKTLKLSVSLCKFIE